MSHLENSFADLASKRAKTAPPAAQRRGGGLGTRKCEKVGARLGKNADFASNLGNQQLSEGVLLPAPSTVTAWYLRSFQKEILKKAGCQKRLRFCGEKITPRASGVGLFSRPDRPFGRFSGVCVCGQSLVCPVCAPRISAFRAVDVAKAFVHCDSLGLEARLVTLTLPHHKNENLGELLDLLAKGYRAFNSGRDAIVRRKNKVGAITAQEINWGAANGWHPHKHQAVFVKAGTFDEDLQRAGWLAALDSIGKKSVGTDLHAYRASLITSDLGASYISKLGLSTSAELKASGANGVSMELAGGANKGRNVIQLLAAAAAGDPVAAQIWLSGVSEIITRKITSLKWDSGFREFCGVPKEKKEIQIAEEEILSTDVYLGELNFHQWRIIVNNRAELALCIAANQGLDAVNAVLIGLGAGVLDMDRTGIVETDPKSDFKLSRDVLDAAAKHSQSLISSAWYDLAEIQREIDKPEGITTAQIKKALEF
jgi:hypothetical protein